MDKLKAWLQQEEAKAEAFEDSCWRSWFLAEDKDYKKGFDAKYISVDETKDEIVPEKKTGEKVTLKLSSLNHDNRNYVRRILMYEKE